MYNVLLADDEQIVIDALGFILERNFPGQFEFFPARSGADAIEACRVRRIDIAFMDINMPGVDGIEAIKAIKGSSPDVMIVVLTAFDRFDYARQAVALGVFEYLSKPVNRGKIVATMRDALAAVDGLRRKQISDSRIRAKLDSVVGIVESDLIYSLIFPSDESRDLASSLEFFGIKARRFYFMTIELPELAEGERAAAYAALRDVVAADGKRIIGPLMRLRAVVFVPLEDGSAEADPAAILEAGRRLHGRLAARLERKVRIGLSGVAAGLDESQAAYNESLKALIASEESSGVFRAADRPEREAGDAYPMELEGRLLERAAAGDVQSVHSLFDGLRAWLGQRYPDDLAIAKHQAYELLALVRRQTQAVQPDFGGFSVWKDTWRRMAALADAAAVAAYALAGLDECIGVMAERRRGRTGPAVNKAKAVIQENLAADLTLDEVARRVEASPFYFSKLFRDETGEDFADYLAAARMRKAKELLLEPSVPVKDIAAAVGYADPNQFSKAFKKAFGQTPTEFRENQ